MFEFEATPIAGVLRVTPRVRPDARGRFVKLFHAPCFEAQGLVAAFPEQYCSTSTRHVLRGCHFQTPPHDHAKLVYALDGRVLDVVLDLRRASPSFGQSFSTKLDGEATRGLYLPRGVAHAFLTLSETATLAYFVETVHDADSDAGVHWASFGFPWPIAAPLTSPRDAALPAFADFDSPF